MAVVKMQLSGLKCPEPAMKVVTQIMQQKAGDIIEATADCDTFENDMRSLCVRWKKVLVSVKQSGKSKTIQVRV